MAFIHHSTIADTNFHIQYSWETRCICPLTSPLQRQVWKCSEAKVDEIRYSLRNTDWVAVFAGLTADEMTSQFTILIMDLMHRFIPNQMIKWDDRDPPWITPKLKTAIKINIEFITNTLREVIRPMNGIM